MMTRTKIKHAANAVSRLYFHGKQIEEQDAMREEIEATRSRKVQTLEAEEYKLRKEIEERREQKELENGTKSLCSHASGSSNR